MSCNRNHRSAPSLATLDPDQSNSEGRHKCPGCALVSGFQDGFDGIEPRFDEIKNNIDDSQAQAGRHKNARQAYNRGYELGKKERNTI